MEEKEIIEKTKEYVRGKLEGEGSGHDWWHIKRVWKNAVTIGKAEKADIYVVQLGALLHDIADFKFHGGDSSVGPKVAREHLEKLGVSEKVISHVCNIVETISFKGAGAEKPMETLEGKVVRDADRLDAIGAIGIARCFSYGGSKGRLIFNPEGSAKEHQSVDSYLKGADSSLHHFYEKLLLLKDLMLTKKGREMAEGRHNYLSQYLEQFHAEWNGER
jgi:uncharacterized protein